MEIQDIAPAARHLAVGHAERILGQRGGQRRDGIAIVDTVAEIAEQHQIGRRIADLLGEMIEDALGDRAVVDLVDLQQAIAAGDDGVLVGGRAGTIDDRHALHARLRQIVEREFRERIFAQHRGKRHVRAGGLQVLGDDAGAADVVVLLLEAHAHRRRLGHAADHGALGEAVDDRVTDHMHLEAFELVEALAQIAEIDPLRLEQQHQLLGREFRRLGLDDVR